MAAESPSREFVARARETRIETDAFARFLDSLSHAERVEAIRAGGRAEQRALYAAVQGRGELRLADLVPGATSDWTPVRHHGRNTLPLFTSFEKRFCRPRGADPAKPESLYGFNYQTMSGVTGPGYFVARDDPARPEVLIDYTQVPSGHPEGWPDVRSNERGLARFVYGFMVDTLRRVSEHVTIGSAARNGRDLGSWFLLTRQD